MTNLLTHLKYWDSASKLPTTDLSYWLLSQTIHPNLHYKFDGKSTSAEIWTSLLPGQKRPDQVKALTKVIQYDMPINMDTALMDLKSQTRNMIATFGSTIKTDALVKLLWPHNLPSNYSFQSRTVQDQEDLEWDKFETALKAEWRRICSSIGKRPTAPPFSASAVPDHRNQ